MRSLPKRVQGLPVRTLHVGEILVSSEKVLVHTTLGTCVAVTLHDPVTKCGAMCHALMPEAPDGHGHPMRYVDRAVEQLLGELAACGIPPNRLQARVVGGVVRPRTTHPALVPVGHRNALKAVCCLREAGLKIFSKHTGGDASRKIYFIPATGELFVRNLPKNACEAN